MKYSRTQVNLVLEALDRLVKTLGHAFLHIPDFRSLRLYLVSSSMLSATDLIDHVNKWITDSFLKEDIMTTAQALIQEGRKEAAREGEARLQAEKRLMAKKLLDLGLTVDQVVQTTGLSTDEIENLQR